MAVSFSGSLDISGSLSTTGTITMSGSIASASFATTASNAVTSSYVVSSQTDATQNTRLTTIEAVTGSYATTGSNQFAASQTITGSLTVTGNINAQTLVVQTITSSVDFVTGSAKFGSIIDNTHQFTGSVLISGSQTTNGTVTANKGLISAGSPTGYPLGELQFSPTTAGSYAGISTNGTTTPTLYFDHRATSNTGNFVFRNGTEASTTLMYIAGSGNVGIGTNSPSYKLEIQTNASASGLWVQTGGTTSGHVIADFRTGTNASALQLLGNNTAIFGGGVTIEGANSTIKSGNELRFYRTDNAAYTKIYDAGSLGANGFVLDNTNSEGFHFKNNGTTIMRMPSNGYVGIGITNPQTQLHMNGTLTFSESGYNTVRLHTITHSHSNGSSPSNYIAFNISDGAGDGTTNEQMRINGAGNVGIGTTSPGGRLDVQASGLSKFSYYFRNSNGGYGGGIYNTGGVNTQLYLATSAGAENVLLAASGVSWLNGGNVGIGTTNPVNRLHLYASNNAASIRLQNTAANKVWDLNPSNPDVSNTGFTIHNVTDNTKPFHIMDSGNIGIGTTSPDAILAVHGQFKIKTTSGDGNENRLFFNPGGAGDPAQLYLYNQAQTNTVYISAAGDSYFNGGNFGIGTATPLVKLESNGNYRIYGGSAYTSYTSDGLFNANATPNYLGTTGQGGTYAKYGGGGGLILGYRDNGNGLYSPAYGFEVKSTDGRPVSGIVIEAVYVKDIDTNTAKFIIYNNGNVQNTNNSYGAISDISLKENIVDATPKLDDLLNVKVRNYNLKDDPNQTKQIGVVAQELEEIFPGMIEINSEGIKSVKYSVFVPILIKAVQELKTELNTANQKIAALESAQ